MTQLGATGEFPDGKLKEDDEGEITIAVGHIRGKVIIDFGTPTTWLGMPPQQARMIANALLNRADLADKEREHGVQENDSN